MKINKLAENVFEFEINADDFDEMENDDLGDLPELPPQVIDMDVEELVKLSLQEQFDNIARLLSAENQELRKSYHMCNFEIYTKMPCVACPMNAPSAPMRPLFNYVIAKEKGEDAVLSYGTDFDWIGYIDAAAALNNQEVYMFAMHALRAHDHENARDWKDALKVLAGQAQVNTAILDTLPWFDFSPEEIEKFVKELPAEETSEVEEAPVSKNQVH